MDMENRIWFLILDHGSVLTKSWGAYRLNTIIKLKETNILAKFCKY